MGITAEFVGSNFTEPIGQTSVQVCKVEGDEYMFGFVNEIDITLFGNPRYACFKSITLSELIELKNAISTLIQRVEDAAKEETNNSL